MTRIGWRSPSGSPATCIGDASAVLVSFIPMLIQLDESERKAP